MRESTKSKLEHYCRQINKSINSENNEENKEYQCLLNYIEDKLESNRCTWSIEKDITEAYDYLMRTCFLKKEFI